MVRKPPSAKPVKRDAVPADSARAPVPQIDSTRVPPTTTDIGNLVSGFRKDVGEYRSKDTKEAAIRQQFIDRFWEALGWDVGDTRQLGPTQAEVIIEKHIETVESTGLRNRRPDYIFRLGGFPRFIVEAKKPAVDIDEDRDAIFQAKQYAWNSTIPFAILTNFEQFRLYDTTLKPIFQQPQRGVIEEFSLDYGRYEAQWDVLYSNFGRDAVSDGALERLLARVKKFKPGRRIRTVDRMLVDLKGGEPVDRVFLSYLDTHRKQFAREIYRRNKRAFPEADTLHGAAKLTEAVQRLMDRLVFMRVCEDRDIIRFGTLREILQRVGNEGGEFYEALSATFRDLDAKYNGYLYKPHPLTDALEVDGNLLADFTRGLYPPEGAWDFAAIGDDILGIVYERFLGNVVTVRQGQAVIEEKPEVRHAGGVYYTPRFIVDTIIRRVVGPKVAGKAPAEVLDVKILDPACGSGSFLVAALQYLFDYCLGAVNGNPSVARAIVPALSAGAGTKGRRKKSDIAFQDKGGRWHLAPDFRSALLTHCIHGVDIDRQAVEVTVMSLYLKMLESKLPENWATLWVERQLLPPLDNNIQCGNSLISEADWFAYAENTKATLFGEDKDIAFRINRFDWTSRTRGFGRLLDSEAIKAGARGGFDCIIGNPPYIRVQELNKWAPEECAFYKWRYKSAAKGNYDIYVVFTERCLSLLVPDGLLGFIMPHKFWQAKYGEGLRKVIADGEHLTALVDFGDQQVFEGATTYTAVHVLSRAPSTNPVDYAKVSTLDDGRGQCADLDASKNAIGTHRFKARRPEGAGPWVFTNGKIAKWLDAVRADHKTLGQLTSKIAQGLVSGCDPVFYVERRGKEFFSDETGRSHALERELIHPLLKGSVHIRRWAFDPTTLAVLFPYRLVKGEWKLISPVQMKEEYPIAHAYLSECRGKLEEREKKERKNESGDTVRGEDRKPLYDRPFAGRNFYRYSRPQNFEVMPCAKLLVPAMGRRAEYAIDEKGEFYFVGSGGGGGGAHAIIPNIKIDLRYLCGLLNSELLDAFLQRVTTPFHSGWFAYSKAYIAQIPIKLPETAEDKKLAKRITDSVRVIMAAKTKLRDSVASFAGIKSGLKSAVLSDRETRSLEAEVEAHEKRINETVFALYGVDGLPE